MSEINKERTKKNSRKLRKSKRAQDCTKKDCPKEKKNLKMKKETMY